MTRSRAHGIVRFAAKSQSAKRYGIRTGEPVANAFRKCSDLVVVPPDHRRYQEYSKRLMDLLRDYTPDIEQVSVDECFMDFTGIAHRFHSPIDGAMEIKNAVRDKFGFTVNVGISTNKLLVRWHLILKNQISAYAFSGRDSGKNVAASGGRPVHGRQIQRRDTS